VNLNLKQIEAFVWVADLGSFRRAADRLNTTQPNISTRIAKLEVALKTVLMERDAGSVRLTAKGREILEHARQVLRVTDGLIDAAGQGGQYDGTLRLGVTEMIVHTWLRDLLKDLKDRFPNVTVELTVDLSVNLERDLAARLIDLAVQNGPFTLQTSGARDLGTYPLVWVAAPRLGLATDRPLTLADLAVHPVLTHARDTRLYQEIAAHFAGHHDMPARLVPSSNLASCIHMAVEGMGIAAVPRAMILREIEKGELLSLDYPWTPESLAFQARYDSERAPLFVQQAAEIACVAAAGHAAQDNK
jgi:DNA-binding transcriptional LysR family regulator